LLKKTRVYTKNAVQEFHLWCGQGLLDLYAATLDPCWLGEAVRLQGKQDELFLDTERGGYFTSKQGDEFVIIRLKEDQVIFSIFYQCSGSGSLGTVSF
jgi:uncharacterized protein YyaL (SSP411 family)